MAKTIEALKEELQLEEWKFAAAKAAFRWAEGKEMEMAEFSAAIERVLGFKYHSHPPVELKAAPAIVPAPPAATPEEPVIALEEKVEDALPTSSPAEPLFVEGRGKKRRGDDS